MMVGRDGSRSSETVIAFRPLRWTLMKFGGPHQIGPGQYYFSVDAGFLANEHTELLGKLVFRWWREGRDEVFQTEVRDYRSVLVGRSANFVQRSVYSLTQMNAHRWVMWRFHLWVQREREALLEGM